MKTTSAALLLITLLISGIFPAFGQKTRQIRSERKVVRSAEIERFAKPQIPSQKDFAEYETIDAVTDGGGAFIRWQMTEETGNMGFLVYRFGKSGFEQASENLITGSLSRLGNETLYGGKYQFFDSDGTLGSTYVIQAIGPYGIRISSKTVTAGYASDIESKLGMSKADMAGISTEQNGQLQNTLPRDLVSAGNTGKKSEQVPLPEAVNLPVHRTVVNTPGIKIGVKKDGFYRVRLNADIAPVTSLFNAGNTANWRLYRDGIEQSVIIGTDGNGVYMDFYGKAAETIETDTAIYYLIVDANNIGKRIPSQRIKRVEPTGVSPSYLATTLKRERAIYDPSILNGNAENFWGNVVISSPKTVKVTLTGVDLTQPTFTVNIDLQGYSTTVTPSVRVVLNGTEIGIANAAFPRGHYSAQFNNVPGNLLVEGENTFHLTSINGSGDASYFDSIRLQYNRAYRAETNRLLFTGAPAKSTTLSGFTSSNIRIFNIGTDGSPIRLTGFNVQQDGPNAYSVLYPATRQRLRPIYAVEDSGLLLSPPVTVNNPSNLSSTVRNADLVIISHSDFMTGSNTWADYRRSAAGGSFNVEVVDAADIYDEYSYGLTSNDAVHSFLQHVYQDWTSQIAGKKYVLLMGDASFDPKNFRNFGSYYYVPTRMVDTIYGEVPADDLLADFNGDGLADMAIGRIPARFGSDITNIYNKTTTFETPAMQSLSRGIVFAYDKPNGYQFGVMSEDLANQIPGAPPTYVSRGLQPPSDPMTTDPNALSNLVNAINVPGSRFIVNYSGHGSQGRWDADFLDNPSVSQLTNANAPAIFTMLTCLNGYFLGTMPGDESISEVLVKSTVGGGVVAWASSGKTTADVQMLMGRRFFQQAGIGNIKRMGDLVIDGKAQTPANSDVRTTWILFGDPMLKVRQ